MKSVRLSSAYIPLTNIKTIVYDYVTLQARLSAHYSCNTYTLFWRDCTCRLILLLLYFTTRWCPTGATRRIVRCCVSSGTRSWSTRRTPRSTSSWRATSSSSRTSSTSNASDGTTWSWTRHRPSRTHPGLWWSLPFLLLFHCFMGNSFSVWRLG